MRKLKCYILFFCFIFILICSQGVLANRNTSAEVVDVLGVDSDGSGLYDYMDMDIGLYLNESGYYEIRTYIGQAVESDSISIYSDSVRDINYAYYFEGENNISVRFLSDNITRGAESDELFFEYILIEKIGEPRTDIILNQSLNSTRSDFEPYPLPEINFIGLVDYGIDTGSNGYYNYLGINVTLNVSVDETYSIYGRIEDGLSNRFYFNEDFNLTVGGNTITLNYSGKEINYFGENSTYVLDKLSVSYNDGQGSLELYDNISDIYTTRLYNYTEFEESPRGEIIGIIDEYVNDTDGDGLYDSLNLVVQVNVSMDENYSLDIELGSEYSLDERYRGELQAGINNITISFNGLQIYYEEINSTLNISEIELSYREGWWDLDREEDYYETSIYNYSDFERPSYITNITRDYANDSDGDGLYDRLILEVEFNATRDNNFSILFLGEIGYENGLTFSGPPFMGTANGYFNEGVNTANVTMFLDEVDSYLSGTFNFSDIYFSEEGYSGHQTYSYNSSVYNYSDFEKSSNIKYSVFNGDTTSNFINASSVENLTLEIVETGKISFKEILNLTDGADFDSYVIIAKKFISVNSSALPELNKSATLQFEGLIGDGYVVYRNGVACGNYCSNFSYAGGILSFDVSGFSNYSVEETFVAAPVVVDDGGSSSGGGGGGGSSSGDVVVNESLDEYVEDSLIEDGEERVSETLDGGIKEDIGDNGNFGFIGLVLVGILVIMIALYGKKTRCWLLNRKKSHKL